MRDTNVTRKQFAAAIFAALLSPMMRRLPCAAVRLAGQGAWLSVFPALPALLLLTSLMNALRRRTRPGEGMANVILRVFGPIFGRAVLLLYGAWFLFYAGFTLHSGAERLVATVYRQSALDPFLLVMLVICLIGAMGTLRATARAAVILRAVLLLALAAVSVFTLPDISWDKLFPLRMADVPGIASGALPIMSIGGVAALFSFLNAYVEPEGKPGKWLGLPLATFLLTALVLNLETIGTYGAALTARLNYPFFTMTRDVTLFGVPQRIEAIVIALWVYADYMLCIMLLRCAYETIRAIFDFPKSEEQPFFDLRRGRWVFLLEAVIVWAVGKFIAPTSYDFLFWSERVVPFISNILVFGGFSVIWLVGKVRRI